MKWLSALLILMFCTVSASADSVWNMKSGSKITGVKINNAPTIVDYQPYSITVKEGNGGTTGNSYIVAIYNSDNSAITNCYTESVNGQAILGQRTLYFNSSSDVLVPGETYKLGVLSSGIIVFAVSTGGNGTSIVAATYPTLPANLAGETFNSDGFITFEVKNKYGEVLLSRGTLEETNTYNYESGSFKFNKVSAGVVLTCETL